MINPTCVGELREGIFERDRGIKGEYRICKVTSAGEIQTCERG